MCPESQLSHNRQVYLFVWLLLPSIFAYNISRWRQGQGNALPPLPPRPQAPPLSPTERRPPALSGPRAGLSPPAPPLPAAGAPAPPRRKQPFGGQLGRGNSATRHSLFSPDAFRGFSPGTASPTCRDPPPWAVPRQGGGDVSSTRAVGHLGGPGETAQCYTGCPQLMMWTEFGLVLWEAPCDGGKPPQGWSVFLEILKASVRGLHAHSQHIAPLQFSPAHWPFSFLPTLSKSFISPLAYCIRLLFQAHYPF